jgi:hypothetical protein
MLLNLLEIGPGAFCSFNSLASFVKCLVFSNWTVLFLLYMTHVLICVLFITVLQTTQKARIIHAIKYRLIYDRRNTDFFCNGIMTQKSKILVDKYLQNREIECIQF